MKRAKDRADSRLQRKPSSSVPGTSIAGLGGERAEKTTESGQAHLLPLNSVTYLPPLSEIHYRARRAAGLIQYVSVSRDREVVIVKAGEIIRHNFPCCFISIFQAAVRSCSTSHTWRLLSLGFAGSSQCLLLPGEHGLPPLLLLLCFHLLFCWQQELPVALSLSAYSQNGFFGGYVNVNPFKIWFTAFQLRSWLCGGALPCKSSMFS